MSNTENKPTNAQDIESYNDSFDSPIGQKLKKKGGRLKKVIIIIAVVLLVLIAAAVTCTVLAFQSPNSDKLSAKPDDTALENIMSSALTGDESYISNDNLNSLIAYFFEANDNANEEGAGELPVKALAFEINENEPCYFFSKVMIAGNEMELSAQFTIDSEINNGEVKLTVISTSLGSLPLPPDLVLNYAFSGDSIASSDFIRREGSDIYLKAEFSPEILGQKLTIGIEKLEPSEGGLTLKISSVIDLLTDAFMSLF